MKKRGIYLVANLPSQAICENLIYSIRESGCTLPIRLIHFGGKEVSSPYILEQVELLHFANFSEEAKKFIFNLRSTLTDCPLGFLYRFLGLFLDWDEFIYSDNDVVALSNWETLFDYLPGYDLVHADEEYRTKGVFNYHRPEEIEQYFGKGALETAITAGHIVVRKNEHLIADMNAAVHWFKENPSIPKKHDQSLLHVASLIGKWNVLNLCKPPYNWLSSWAGDYHSSLKIILHSQTGKRKISHIHYSGFVPNGDLPIQELIFSNVDAKQRLKRLFFVACRKYSGFDYLEWQRKRVLRKLRSLQKNSS